MYAGHSFEKQRFVDFYDYKVSQAEGFGKERLFAILDTLRAGSDALLLEARERLAAEKGPAALNAWNTGRHLIFFFFMLALCTHCLRT